MADAPTTEEVRQMLAYAERDDRRAGAVYGSGPDTAPGYEMALKVAEHRDALAAEVERLRADIAHFQRAASQAEQTRRDLVNDRDALAAEVARLRPLAELGALALAWGRAMRECETARTVPERRNAAYDTAASAKARLATAVMRMAEEEKKR